MNRNLGGVLYIGKVLYDMLILLIILVACVKFISAYLSDKNNNDINKKLNDINIKLQAAIENCNLEIMKSLVKNGKDSPKIGERALFGAAEEGCLEIVKFLLDRETIINASRALLYAARGAQPEVVKLLLESGANPCYKNEDSKGRTAKIMAIKMSLYPINRNSNKPYREVIDLLRDAEKKCKSEQLN